MSVRICPDAVQGYKKEPSKPSLLELRGLLGLQMSIMEEVAQMSWGSFKPKVADAIIAHLEPIQAKYTEVMSDPAVLDKVILLCLFSA